ncbi:unnamed protein product (macronuclear) [Paramecium tetraurelia]|uniref:Uncharacterized protein n=1 Tax=Paramecium tetraurelia TaxID=5888 RepID=A0BBH0_PARTE|nr:uncharacterized protein GSPATT00000322001 [Paramecium tetraurelia]CAK55887.1 unnamed protein product [Paramecium tetraurelia]|eukprot:XP_001423285.1 hypothetical protein (macronuclear) [Paramecium tetraurelia strain d4-2]
MSILSEHTISIKSETITMMSVSHSAISPSIAICTISRVMLYNDQGEKFDYELARNQKPTAIAWHPIQPQLSIGWQNGTITIWQEDTRTAKEESAVHKEEINLIQYNTNGSRMVSADISGLVVVWRGITPMSTYQKEGIMTICIFADLNNIIKAQNLFFFGGKSGLVCLADDSKHCSEVCKVVGSIKCLMIYEKYNSVIIITSGLLLVQFKISTSEKTQPDKKVKLSIAGEPESLQSVWIGQCLIAISSNENMIRMFQLEADENYVITLHEFQEQYPNEKILNDKITCVQYSKKSKNLVAGTKDGRLVFWKNYALTDESPVESEQWKALKIITLNKTVNEIAIGKNSGVIAARSADSVRIVQESLVHGKIYENVRVLQVEHNKILIYFKNDSQNQDKEKGPWSMFLWDSKFPIKSIDCSQQHLLVQSANKIEISEFTNNSQILAKSSFDRKCVKAALFQEDLILFYEYKFEVTNFKGVQKYFVDFSESDGIIANYEFNNKTMVIWTHNNYFRLYDFSRREAQLSGFNCKFENDKGPLGTIKQCAVNCDGSNVAIIADNHGNQNDLFFVYNPENNNFQSFELPQYRKATQIMWDYSDPRFFGVTTICTKIKTNSENDVEEEQADFRAKKFFTFFFNPQTGIKEQDCYVLDEKQEGVLSIRIPHINVIQKKEQSYRIQDILMNDFTGLERADEPTKRAVINFSYHLSCGNLDEAYKSVKAIQNPTVWEKMAQMSVKTRRLDVAEICIGNMRFARGAKAIRETKKEPEFEAQLAMVAIQLNMISEAEKLYYQCKRYDLLNKLYQAQGQWEKALEIAGRNTDRINLLINEWDKAIQYYEKSGNAQKEIPRMFYEADELQYLEGYVLQKKDPVLYKWWGNHLESQEQYEEAMKFYRDSNDALGIVRVLLHQDNVRHAKETCNDKNDPAAPLLLSQISRSPRTLSLRPFNIIQRLNTIVKPLDWQRRPILISDVTAISLQAPKLIMIQSAIYFEQKKIIDKAVLLYMRGGQLQKALQLAQKEKLTDYVKKINQEIALQKQETVDLTFTNTGSLKEAPSQQKLGNQQQPQQQSTQSRDKAPPPGSLQDLINKKQFEKVLEMCDSQGLQITDDLVKQMLDGLDDKRKKEVQLLIAEKSKKMGNFEQASKMYIQMGERVKAMKALCKLGDVEKIIAFANNARMAEIYILAGNYLQTGDWHKTPELMKHIIQFYSKAKAFDHLANFFEACSSVEIDEYRDYDKACAALKEAIKYSDKSTNQQKTQQLQQKLKLINDFVQAKQKSPQEMLQLYYKLLNDSNIEYAVRQGDIFAELIEYYYAQGQYEKAYEEMQKMQKKSIVLNPYLDQELIQKVMNYMKQKVGSQQQQQQQSQQNKKQPFGRQQEQNEDDFQEEEVIDDGI